MNHSTLATLPESSAKDEGFALVTHPDAPERAPDHRHNEAKRNAGGGFGPGKKSRAGRTIIPAVKPHTEVIHARLKEFKERTGASLADLEKSTQVSRSILSQYLNGKAVGDVARHEALIADFLKQEEMRGAAAATDEGELFPTFVSTRIKNICTRTQTRGCLAAIHGEPGIGKSCGIALYQRDDRVSISFELNVVAGGGTCSALVRHFFREVDTGSFYKHDQTKGEWILERFQDSKRLVIIDNAHLLTKAGLEWVLGFHDETHCPVVLVGNVELKGTMRLVRRAQSRFGILEELNAIDRMGKSKFAKPVQEFLSKRWPEAAEVLFRPALELVEGSGAMRALRIAVGFAQDLLSGKEAPTALDAFSIAVSKMPTKARLNA